MGERSFFVDPGIILAGRAEIRGQVAHQISRVLRLHPGDNIELLDNSGALYVSRITDVSRDAVTAEVAEERHPATEPPARVDLYQALLKGEKMEWVLQKGTEIGISRFVPVLSERCVSRPAPRDMMAKLERWRTIVREAAEQCGRVFLPEVTSLEDFRRACVSAGEANLAVVAWEGEHSISLASLLRDDLQPGGRSRPWVSLMIGPEGGFSSVEAALAAASGLRTASLGPRILRAETAALVAATAVLWETGGLGG